MNREPSQCIVTTIVLAFCSMVYELLLAQTMATLFGNSITSYSLTIGLYICAMGIGSLMAPEARATCRQTLGRLEIWLTAVGVSAPFAMGLAHSVISAAGIDLGVSFALCCALVVIIGLMSGAELPLLMTWAKQDSDREHIALKVLAWDYVGTFVATIVFPLVLYPTLGLLHVATLTASLNLAAASFIFPRASQGARWRWALIGGIAVLLFVVSWQEPAARRLLLSTLNIREVY